MKEVMTYFKDKNRKSEKEYKNCEALSTILETVDILLISLQLRFCNIICYWF